MLPEGVEEYCERHTTALTELHERLLKETEEKTTTANFLVGELEGAFLKMLVRMTQAKRILEVGMFTGYSALSFAEALPPDGSIITCEVDPLAIEIARRFFAQSPHRDKIQIREGRAADTLKTLQGPFDLGKTGIASELFRQAWKGAIWTVKCKKRRFRRSIGAKPFVSSNNS